MVETSDDNEHQDCGDDADHVPKLGLVNIILVVATGFVIIKLIGITRRALQWILDLLGAVQNRIGHDVDDDDEDLAALHHREDAFQAAPSSLELL